MSPTQRNVVSLEDNDLRFFNYSNFTIKYGVYKQLHHISGLLQMIKQFIRPPQDIVISIGETNLCYCFRVTGDSLLINEFAYSLFISLCSITSDMTGYSHSYHSIKLIHCGAPERDACTK